MMRLGPDWVICWCGIAFAGCSLPEMYGDWISHGGASGVGSQPQGGAVANNGSRGGAVASIGSGGGAQIVSMTWGGESGSGGVAAAASTSVTAGMPSAGESATADGGDTSVGGSEGAVDSTPAGIAGDGGASGDGDTGGMGGIGRIGTGGMGGMSTGGRSGTGGMGGRSGMGGLDGKSGGSGVSVAGAAGAPVVGGIAGVAGTAGTVGTAGVPAPKRDVVCLDTFPERTYSKVAASKTQLYFLTGNGGTEIWNLDPLERVVEPIGTNFTAIDYVKGWDLIATRDWDGSRGVFINLFGDTRCVVGDYPPGMTAVTDVAAFDLNNAVGQLRICVIGGTAGSPFWLQCGTHTQGAPVVIAWDTETYAISSLARGLAAMTENATEYLIQQEYFPNLRLARFAAPKGTRQLEQLGSYVYHAYVDPNFGNFGPTNDIEIFAPLSLDYEVATSILYALDDCYDRTQKVARQCLVTLNRADVRF